MKIFVSSLVAITALGMYAPLWRSATPAAPREGAPLVSPAARSEWSPAEIHELGWIEPERYVPLARSAVTDGIVPALRALGLVVPEAELAALLAD